MENVPDLATFEVRLDKLAYGGEAIGRLPDGRAVFVPFALPGELVRGRLVEDKRGYARGELVEVLEASSERIEPRCRHFGVCGGCHYQHMRYEKQLEAEAEILREQLVRIGGFEDPRVMPTLASLQPWHYRNHVQFHLDGEGKLGFYAARPEKVMAVEECHLPEKALNELWPALAFEAGTGVERVGLRLGAEGERMLILEGRKPPEVEIGAAVSAVYLGEEGAHALAGAEALEMEVLGRRFRVSAGSFFQVNTGVAEKIVNHLLEKLPLGSDSTLLELYCGVGLLSAFLAPRVGRLVGVEASASACEDFAANLDEFENVELYEARAEEALPHLDIQPDIILADPPRAGLDKRAVDAILEMAPKLFAYVSCDPATLARDGKRLARGGYRLLEARPFDMFPQTYHIESVSLWGRG